MDVPDPFSDRAFPLYGSHQLRWIVNHSSGGVGQVRSSAVWGFSGDCRYGNHRLYVGCLCYL
ncbi:Uncharacterised protein [Vibrio cholerae]|nr:Uncharacterised protein [Vibrio cholerae]